MPGLRNVFTPVHSRYRRRLSDTAITGREVVIRLRVRRLFCDNSDCGRRTFAEQVPGLATRHARGTSLLQRLLCAVALALGGRAGARMTGHLAATVSRMTLPRQISALPDSDRATPRVLGVVALAEVVRGKRRAHARHYHLPEPLIDEVVPTAHAFRVAVACGCQGLRPIPAQYQALCASWTRVGSSVRSGRQAATGTSPGSTS